jgi:hypothetical protein
MVLGRNKDMSLSPSSGNMWGLFIDNLRIL